MAIGLRENQCFWHFLTVGKHFRQTVAEGADHGTNLVRIDDRHVELLSAVGLVFVLLPPPFGAGQSFTLFDQLLSLQSAAGSCDLRIDQIYFITDIDPVRHRLFVRIFADDVLLEEAVGAIVGCRGKTDKKAVEIFDNLSPQIVDRAVTFVDDDDIEEFGRQFRIVNDWQAFLADLSSLRRIFIFRSLRQRFVFQDRIHALYG